MSIPAHVVPLPLPGIRDHPLVSCVPGLIKCHRPTAATPDRCGVLERAFSLAMMWCWSPSCLSAGKLRVIFRHGENPAKYIVLSPECYRGVFFALLITVASIFYVESCVFRGGAGDATSGQVYEMVCFLLVTIPTLWLLLKCLCTDPSIASIPIGGRTSSVLGLSSDIDGEASRPAIEIPWMANAGQPLDETTPAPGSPRQSYSPGDGSLTPGADQRQRVVFNNVKAVASALMYRHYCVVCRIRRAIRSHHCRECDVCTHHSDHHCGMLGACIGKGNIKYFFGFLVFVAVFVDWILVGSMATLLDPRIVGISSRPAVVALSLIVPSLLSFLPLNAAAGFYVYLYLWLGHVTAREYRKAGSLYEGFELETNMREAVPRPFGHGTMRRNLAALIRLTP